LIINNPSLRVKRRSPRRWWWKRRTTANLAIVMGSRVCNIRPDAISAVANGDQAHSNI